MKLSLSLFFIILVNAAISQSLDFDHLVGSWEFIELQDKVGVAHKEIPLKMPGKRAVEFVVRYDYIFNSDSTYSGFNSFETIQGLWFFDKTKNALNLESMISTDRSDFTMMKKQKLVIMHRDGYYYRKVKPIRVLKFDGTNMILEDRDGYVLVYKRID